MVIAVLPKTTLIPVSSLTIAGTPMESLELGVTRHQAQSVGIIAMYHPALPHVRQEMLISVAVQK